MSDAEKEVAEVETPVEQEQTTEPQAGSVPADGQVTPEQPEVNEAEDKERKTQAKFAKKQTQIAEQRKRAEEAEARAKEFEERLQKLEQVPTDIPKAPDPLDYESDSDYQAALNRRDTAIRQAAEREGVQKAQQERERLASEETARERQRSINEKAEKYVSRAKKLEVSTEDLQKAGQTIVSFGVSDEFVDFISTHPDGPLIAVHLAANTMELDELAGMSAYQQADHIREHIMPKVSELKPKPSQAPDPATTLDGNGAQPAQSPWLAKGTYS
jgi:hypothetical protein